MYNPLYTANSAASVVSSLCAIFPLMPFPCFSRGFHQASVLLTTFHLFSQVITILAQTMQVTLFMTAKQANKTATGNGKPPCISTIHITHRDLSTSHLVPSVSKCILLPNHLTFFEHFKLSFRSSNRQTKVNTA